MFPWIVYLRACCHSSAFPFQVKSWGDYAQFIKVILDLANSYGVRFKYANWTQDFIFVSSMLERTLLFHMIDSQYLQWLVPTTTYPPTTFNSSKSRKGGKPPEADFSNLRKSTESPRFYRPTPPRAYAPIRTSPTLFYTLQKVSSKNLRHVPFPVWRATRREDRRRFFQQPFPAERDVPETRR